MIEEVIIDEALREELLESIDRSARGKYRLMIKNLMDKFGYSASQRVRRSSLAEVTRELSEWGIEHEFSGGFASGDYVYLYRKPEQSTPSNAVVSPLVDDNLELQTGHSPFTFAFQVNEIRDEARSLAACQDLFGAIWTSRPVLLLIDAADEFFALAGGVVAAMMRRRNAMFRQHHGEARADYAPQLLSLGQLKASLGQGEDPSALGFPVPGAVYLSRFRRDETQLDELITLAREVFIPHTYRLKARFATTNEKESGGRAVDDARFHETLIWLAAFAGGRGLTHEVATGEPLSLASLFSEACQIRDALIERVTLGDKLDDLCAGLESTEHMVLKGLVARFLRDRNPSDTVDVEHSIARDAVEDDHEGGIPMDAVDLQDRGTRARPDVRVRGKLCVEVETLRSVALPGSNPFFALEQKLRRKISAFERDGELWIVVPSDVALLAEVQLHAVARNVKQGRPELRVRLATMDLVSGNPIFLRPRLQVASNVRLVGAPWSEASRQVELARLTWNDIAGYSDLKSRLHGEVLAPLREPQRYSQYNVRSSNGLLLYGLPGCGKSLIGRVLAGEADLICRLLGPSDLGGLYLYEGVMKTRELFDWALKQPQCLLVIDELDGIAPQRSDHNMHSDEKRQVNELLTQLDRVKDKPVIVVATTNYFRGIDSAVRRAGRFDLKIPIFPPDEHDRKLIFDYYLSPPRIRGMAGTDEIDTARVAKATPLFAPADIEAVVQGVARAAIARAIAGASPRLSEKELLAALGKHSRSIQEADARQWIEEAASELGSSDAGLLALEREVDLAYGPRSS